MHLQLGVSKVPGTYRLELLGVSVSKRRRCPRKCVNGFSLWTSALIFFLLVFEPQQALCRACTGVKLAVKDRSDASALSFSRLRAN